MADFRRAVTGWGGTAASVAEVTTVGQEQLGELITTAGNRGVIARGLGRSYGDPAQNAGGVVLTDLPSGVAIDPGRGTARVGAGTSLHSLIRSLLPRGYFVPVTPGTRRVTVGGAVAADVHGKNHHRVGSFGEHVEWVRLLTADGVVRQVGPQEDGELFWATVGGMGLTGIMLEVGLRLLPVDTGHMLVRTERLPNLGAVMQRMEELDERVTYSVAWIDTLARGRSMGRSVLTTGEHAALSDLPSGTDRWAAPTAPRLGAPPLVPPGLVSHLTIRAFNQMWFHKAPKLREDELQSSSTFFHPLDALADWNRLYGPRGFVQYQLVIPDSAESSLARILEVVTRAGHPSFLSVLKRFGPANQGMLSFPMRGWTLALDLPVDPGLVGVFRQLDDLVLEAGGRLYLAKDSRMSRTTLETSYPRTADFRRVRDRVDPDRVFQSDQSRRLGL